MLVSKAAVLGAGTMGGQIAQTIAAAGVPVVLKDVRAELLEAGLAEARRVTTAQLTKRAERGKLAPEQVRPQAEQICARIAGSLTYEGFSDVDFVIEAVPERLDLKLRVFEELDACTPGHAILASNTSSLSISELALATTRPELVVGFHYFYPAVVMPLLEVVAGEESSQEALTLALAFAMAIRKQPILCADSPGFVVNRILSAGMSAIWRAQEEQGLSIELIDERLVAARALPVGPFRLANELGLDTVLEVARGLAQSYGEERFHVPGAIERLVSEGKLGRKTDGVGLYGPDGRASIAGSAEPDADELVELHTLSTVVEACLVLEERVATHRDIDFALMAGAGRDPRRGLLPPFVKADLSGLDTVLERLERARECHGERFAPPRILRRLTAQGRLGQKRGQGFYPYMRPDGQGEPQTETVKLESRPGGVAIAWLSNGQLNAISAAVIADLGAVWERVKASGARVLVLCSANPFVFSAGADVKALAGIEPGADARVVADAGALFSELATGPVATIAAVNGLALGGGCELALACDVRICARSALFAQPEIKLGIMPGFGATQRLPRLIGQNMALEMNLLGDPLLAEEAHAYGLVNRIVEDHELLDTALAWARRLSESAPRALAQIKRVSAAADLEQGLAQEREAFVEVFASEDAREGIAAFLERREPRFSGR